MLVDLASLNAAFWDLGLRFSWDEKTWAKLAKLPDLRSQLEFYLQNDHPHLLAVYDVDFLAKVIADKLANPGDPRTGMEAHHSS